MIIIQYTLSIPEKKQAGFIRYSKEVLLPTWKKYGCKRYECVKVEDEKLVDKQIQEQNKFVERLYFGDDFDIRKFYDKARRNDPEITRAYEKKFNAQQIELRILKQLV